MKIRKEGRIRRCSTLLLASIILFSTFNTVNVRADEILETVAENTVNAAIDNISETASENAVNVITDEIPETSSENAVTLVFTNLDTSKLEESYQEQRAILAKDLNDSSYTQAEIIKVSEEAQPVIMALPQTDSSGYYSIYKEHCSNLSSTTATTENLINAYSRAGYLYESESIDAYTFRQILNMLEYSYSQYGVYVAKDEYLKASMNAYYEHSWDRTSYSDYISTLFGYGNLGNPYGYNATPSGEILLATAYAVGSSWARGESTNTPTRYDQGAFPLYTSVISNKQFTVRPDCTGFCYTILKELDCQSVDAVDADGIFYSGSMVTACENGTFAADPNLEVLPFEVEALQPGDIMVTSDAKTVNFWGSDRKYGRNGHAEIFVGFPDENNHSIIDVWNWGGRSVVEKNWPINQETYIPERKAPTYNFSYIIRYVGGSKL